MLIDRPRLISHVDGCCGAILTLGAVLERNKVRRFANPPSPLHQTGVAHRFVQPCPEGLRLIDAADVAVGIQQGVLHHIFGVFGVPAHEQAEAIRDLLGPHQQLFHRLTVARGGVGHQRRVFGPGVCGARTLQTSIILNGHVCRLYVARTYQRCVSAHFGDSTDRCRKSGDIASVTDRRILHLWKDMLLSVRTAAATLTVVIWCAPVIAAQELLTVDRAVQNALTQNASLRATRTAVSEADAHVDETRSGWFPRVSISETWQRGDQPVFVFSSLLAARQFSAANFAPEALNHPDPIGFFRSSIAIEQLLFDGGRQRSVVDGANAHREIAQLTTDEASAALALATVQAYGRTVMADATGRAAQAALEAAREDLTRAQHRRDTGMATDGDVLALVAHVADLQQQVIHNQGDAAVSRAELNRLMGVPIQREYDLAPLSDSDSMALASTTVETLLAEAEHSRPELRRAEAAQRLAESDRKNARAALIPQIAAQGAFDFSGTQFSNRASGWLAGAGVRWNLSLGGAERAQLKSATDASTRAAAEAEAVRAAVHVEVITALRQLQTAHARRSAGRAAVEQARESQRITRDRFEAGLASVTDVLRASSTVVDAENQRVSAVVDAVVSEAMLRRALGRNP